MAATVDYRPEAVRVILDHGTDPDYMTLVERAEEAGLDPDVLADVVASARLVVSW